MIKITSSTTWITVVKLDTCEGTHVQETVVLTPLFTYFFPL